MASIDQETASMEVPETRKLMSLGEPPHKVVVTMSRAHWGCFDYLVNTVGYLPAELVDLVEQEACYAGRKFHDIFPCCIVGMDLEYSKTIPEPEESD